jgi:hypothetical protein
VNSPEYLIEGESFSFGNTDVVVVALFDGYTLPQEGDNRYRFRECETGIMKWRFAGSLEEQKFWELSVVWDNDPTRQARRVNPVCIEIIGLELNRERTYTRQPANCGELRDAL